MPSILIATLPPVVFEDAITTILDTFEYDEIEIQQPLTPLFATPRAGLVDSKEEPLVTFVHGAQSLFVKVIVSSALQTKRLLH